MKTSYLIAPALIAFLVNQGCVSDVDEANYLTSQGTTVDESGQHLPVPEVGVEQMELVSGSCPTPVRTCEPCSGGLYRAKTVTWLLTHSEKGWECTATITYGSCQPTCAL